MKNVFAMMALLTLIGCGNTKMQEAKVTPANKCRHSAEELSKIPFGPTGTDDYLTRIDNKEFGDAGYNHYMNAYAWGAFGLGGLTGFVSPDGMQEAELGGFEQAPAEKIAVMNRLKNEYEKLPTITYVYCDKMPNDDAKRNPFRYNPKYPVQLRAENPYGPDMQFLYFEDENCRPVYKTPGENRGNIILWEVCRPLAPGEKMPMWSVS